jgi:2-polyprenyl-3-methyl-5-hydroxy-6-metoxy-1,4-benzoquinol methylase
MSAVLEEIAEQRRLVERKKMRYSLDFSRHYHESINAIILSRLAADPSLAVLDCGCGTGILLPVLHQHYKRIVGLDLSIDNLNEARVGGNGTPLLSGDISQLPFAPRSFDQVICRDALHHLPDIRCAFRQLFEITRDGGDVVIMEPIRDSSALHLVRVLGRLCTARTYTTGQWIDAAQDAGFRSVWWCNLGYLGIPLLGYPEVTHLMRHLPLRMRLAKLLMRVDERLARLPYIRTFSWKAVFHFRKPAVSA